VHPRHQRPSALLPLALVFCLAGAWFAYQLGYDQGKLTGHDELNAARLGKAGQNLERRFAERRIPIKRIDAPDEVERSGVLYLIPGFPRRHQLGFVFRLSDDLELSGFVKQRRVLVLKRY
jgi:hypothetical protein